ncbi:MAG: hypothetical protein HWE26_17015 [Alteromonadaceae bacterium]|nr:hypothetical protein [Alteromonadaceae bacterium]
MTPTDVLSIAQLLDGNRTILIICADKVQALAAIEALSAARPDGAPDMAALIFRTETAEVEFTWPDQAERRAPAEYDLRYVTFHTHELPAGAA